MMAVIKLIDKSMNKALRWLRKATVKDSPRLGAVKLEGAGYMVATDGWRMHFIYTVPDGLENGGRYTYPEPKMRDARLEAEQWNGDFPGYEGILAANDPDRPGLLHVLVDPQLLAETLAGFSDVVQLTFDLSKPKEPILIQGEIEHREVDGAISACAIIMPKATPSGKRLSFWYPPYVPDED